SGFTVLTFWVHGGPTGGQHISVCAVDEKKAFGVKVDVGNCLAGGAIPAGKWALVIVPLNRLNTGNRTITGISFQEARGQTQPPVYLADIKFEGRKPSAPHRLSPAALGESPPPYTITIDTGQDVHPISPLIYGLASARPDYLRDLRLGCNRWGGNPNTRYN